MDVVRTYIYSITHLKGWQFVSGKLIYFISQHQDAILIRVIEVKGMELRYISPAPSRALALGINSLPLGMHTSYYMAYFLLLVTVEVFTFSTCHISEVHYSFCVHSFGGTDLVSVKTGTGQRFLQRHSCGIMISRIFTNIVYKYTFSLDQTIIGRNVKTSALF